jgi:anti-sigma B factor antagonist
LPNTAQTCFNRLRRVAAPPPLGAPSFAQKEYFVADLGPDRDPVAGLAERGDALVLSLAGELDLYTEPALREALRGAVERAPKRLVVDLAEVTFVDSTVLGALVAARSQLGGGDAFALAAPGLEVRRALEVSGLDRHFTVYDRIETAFDSI